MPLNKANITIPLAKGIDTKTDAKHVDPMGLLTLENGRLDKTGTIEKRNGHSYSAAAPEGTNREWKSTSTLISHDGSELVQIGQQQSTSNLVDNDGDWRAATYDTTQGKWHNVGQAMPMELSLSAASRSTSGIVNPDVARANGYLCYVWANGGNVLYSLIEESTGAVVIQDQSLSATASEAPKVLAIANKFWIWALNTSVPCFKYAVLDTDSISTKPTSLAVFAGAGTPHADFLWDAVQLTHSTHGDCSVICYKDSAAGGLIVRWIDDTPTLQASVTVPSLTPPINCIGCNKVENQFGVDFLSIAWQHNPGGGVSEYHQIMAMDNSWVFANPMLLATGTDTAKQITMIECLARNGAAGPQAIRYWFEYDNGTYGPPSRPDYEYVRIYEARIDTGASYGLIDTVLTAGLASRGFVADGRPRVWFTHQGDDTVAVTIHTNQQPSLYLSGSRSTVADVHARALAARSDGLQDEPGLSKVLQNGTDSDWLVAAVRQDRSSQAQRIIPEAIETGPVSVSVVGVRVETPSNSLDHVESGDDLVIATGGTLSCKTGGLLTECGFHSFPEELNLVQSTSGGNLTDSTTYYYTAIYEWTDRAGQVHRSATAPVQSALTGSPGTNANKMTATVDSLIWTDAVKATEVLVCLYRRCSDGLYHRVDTQTNTPSAVTTTCTDTITDAVAIGNETLYTTGGILENTGPEATRIVTGGGGRIAYVPEEDRTLVALSKVRSSGLGPEFAIELTRRVSDGGDITGLAYMGQSYIVFKESEIHAFGGNGPNVLGIGSWSPNRKLAGNVGCSERKSIVDCGVGIAFRSKKGIFLLTPSGETKYIGAPVESYNGTLVKCAVHVPDDNQVRWYLADNETTLVWDYSVNQWSMDTCINIAASPLQANPIDVCLWDGSVTAAVSPGKVYQQDSTYRDGTSDIDLKIGTAWFTPGDTLGAQRVWWVYLLGEYKSPHTLTVSVYYDYNDTAAETFSWAFTSDPDPYLLRFKPARQRCTAFRLEIEDSAQSGTYEGFSLSAVKLVIGVRDKRGPSLRASRTL